MCRNIKFDIPNIETLDTTSNTKYVPGVCTYRYQIDFILIRNVFLIPVSGRFSCTQKARVYTRRKYGASESRQLLASNYGICLLREPEPARTSKPHSLTFWYFVFYQGLSEYFDGTEPTVAAWRYGKTGVKMIPSARPVDKLPDRHHLPSRPAVNVYPVAVYPPVRSK